MVSRFGFLRGSIDCHCFSVDVSIVLLDISDDVIHFDCSMRIGGGL